MFDERSYILIRSGLIDDDKHLDFLSLALVSSSLLFYVIDIVLRVDAINTLHAHVIPEHFTDSTVLGEKTAARHASTLDSV